MLQYKCVANCNVYYHYAPNRTCLLNCPSGYYHDNEGMNNKFCKPCVSPCDDCIDTIKCLSCLVSLNKYFYNYGCLDICPNGYFKDNTSMICDNCISPCDKCTSKLNCLSCSEGYWNGTVCTTKCSSGYFGNNVTKNCDLCASPCKTCSNSSTFC